MIKLKKKSIKKNESIYLITQTYCSSYVTEIISKTNYNGRMKLQSAISNKPNVEGLNEN